MSHNLSIQNGKAEMAYVKRNGAPWHGLGVPVDVRAMTATQALEAAHLDWRVAMRPIEYIGENETIPVPGYYATVRTDTGAPLGVVTRNYKVLQNSEALSWVDSAIGAGDACIETVGALHGGRRVWILARLPEPINMGQGGTDDIVLPYFLLANGHDGRHAVDITLTPVRVVCQNTLTAAIGGSKQTAKIFHRGDVLRNVEIAALAIGAIRERYLEATENWRKLQTAPMGLLGPVLDSVAPRVTVPARGSIPEERYGRLVNAANRVLAFRDSAIDYALQDALRTAGDIGAASLWNGWNGIVEAIDHDTKFRTAASRFESITSGDGAARKRLALESALAVAGNFREE